MKKTQWSSTDNKLSKSSSALSGHKEKTMININLSVCVKIKISSWSLVILTCFEFGVCQQLGMRSGMDV